MSTVNMPPISPNGQPQVAVQGSGYEAMPIPDTTNLSPDAMILYCQTQLDGLDSKIRGLMAAQRKSTDDQNAINAALQTFNKYPNGDMRDGGNAQMCQDLENALNAALDKVGRDTPAGQRLQDVLNQVHATGLGDDKRIAPEEMQGFVSDLKNIGSDLSSNAEINMVEIQSNVSTRQTTVQLTTNIVQSLGETSKLIAGNTGGR
jgi:hypothetical protein